MGSIEETLVLEGKMPSFYKRYIDHTFTIIMPDTASAAKFLEVFNNCHSPVKFTMEKESNSLLPFLRMQLLNRDPHIETKVYIKPTSTDLLLHYQSHVDMRHKRGFLKTMLGRAYRLSSCWSYFPEECDHLRAVFSRLKYPQHLMSFVASKVEDRQLIPAPKENPAIRIVLPFKDQDLADLISPQTAERPEPEDPNSH